MVKEENYIYYVDPRPVPGGIYKMDIDGKEEVKLTDDFPARQLYVSLLTKGRGAMPKIGSFIKSI